ncbi:MAG: c-type cytochrome [bacterium]|jgi:cytochrome c oxidase subunit 2
MHTWMRLGMLLLVGLSLATFAHAKGDPERGQWHYATCGGCHASNGNGMPKLQTPALAGQEDWYLKRQILNFKKGIRGYHDQDELGRWMRPMADMLIDEQVIDDVVAYLTTLEAYNPPKTVKGDLVLGKKQYDTSCAACHGAQGEGNEALHAPQVAGQQDWYVVRQLKNFYTGVRGAHPEDQYGAMMRGISLTLPDENVINSIAAYVATFERQP